MEVEDGLVERGHGVDLLLFRAVSSPTLSSAMSDSSDGRKQSTKM